MTQSSLGIRKRWLSSREAADYLGFNQSTLRTARATGLLSGKEGPRFLKVGSTVRYELAELDRWVLEGQEND